MSSSLLVILTLLLSIGLTLSYVGSLIAMLSAFGQRKPLAGLLMLLLPPLALFYSLQDRLKHRYALRLLTFGLLALLLTALLGALFGDARFWSWFFQGMTSKPPA
ncbi:hypothetical protein [Leeia sp.]|uniref:hypothetical protein n=1 Tax=Leeia sp. TaxID=2884678 RepID=UPI0035AD9BB4